MNPNVNSLRDQAYTAANTTADLQGVAQPMLDQLKQNLVGIFAKDNPIIGARNDALAGYLSSNANTRASLLPSNAGDVPGIAGRPLTYSPTQQDAIVSSRNAAALAPLVGYNEILKGMYGNIGDLVGNAGNIYNSTIQGSASRASGLMDLYKQAVAEDQFNQQMQLEKQKATQSAAPLLPPELLAALLDGGGGQVQGARTQDLSRLSKYETPVKQAVPAKAQPKVNLQSTIKAAGPAGIPGGNQLVSGAPVSGNSGGWALQPILDWIKGFGAPKTNFASSSSLGF